MKTSVSTPFATRLACLCLAALPCSGWSHDDEHQAPPPPAERRTNVSDEALAKQVKDTAETNKTIVAPPELPPLPAGVEDLKFSEFYKFPVGAEGLEPTERLKSLNGKRVRILGFMAQIRPEKKRDMIFSTVPLRPQPEEYGVADEIPATHVLVTVPGNESEEVPFTPGPMLLTGVITVGNEGGETSFVRMKLDVPATDSK